MHQHSRIVAGVVLAASAAIGVATASAATLPVGTGTPPSAQGERPMRGPGHGPKMGGPFEHLRRAAVTDFAAIGVTKPVFWDSLTAWLASDDAKKLAEYVRQQKLAPVPGEAGGVLSKVDFAKAGVAKPAFWDALVSWVKTDDAKKVMAAKIGQRVEKRFEHLSDEFGAVDFSKAGIAKPAFWGDLVTWLKSEDAGKLAGYLVQNRAPKA